MGKPALTADGSLVVIEMLNAMNALSSSESLVTLPLWKNPYLVLAISLSMALHFILLYVPFFQGLFAIVPLNWNEWQAVLWISIPVMYEPKDIHIHATIADSTTADSSTRYSSFSREESIFRNR